MYALCMLLEISPIRAFHFTKLAFVIKDFVMDNFFVFLQIFSIFGNMFTYVAFDFQLYLYFHNFVVHIHVVCMKLVTLNVVFPYVLFTDITRSN